MLMHIKHIHAHTHTVNGCGYIAVVAPAQRVFEYNNLILQRFSYSSLLIWITNTDLTHV